MKCEYCGKDANYEFWTVPATCPRRFLCEHHYEVYRETWLMGNGQEELAMLIAVAEESNGGERCNE